MPPLPALDGTDATSATGAELPGDEFFAVIFPSQPSPQSRWSILFRFISIVPLLLAQAWFSIGLIVVVPWAWVATLVTSRVPNGARRYLTKYHRLRASNQAYAGFVTGSWPGVQWNARAGAAVRVSTGPVTHRRWAVFARVLLALPASLIAWSLTYVSVVLQAVQWVWGLVTGCQPVLLHQWRVVVMRFTLRLSGFVLLLTPLQPFRGLFGDPVALADRPGAVATSRALRGLVIATVVLGVPLNLYVTRSVPSTIRHEVASIALSAARQSMSDQVATIEALPQNCAPQPVNQCGLTNTSVAAFITAVTTSHTLLVNVRSIEPGSSRFFAPAVNALRNELVDVESIVPLGLHSEAVSLQRLQELQRDQVSFDAAMQQWLDNL